jgi:hypothetical protein
MLSLPSIKLRADTSAHIAHQTNYPEQEESVKSVQTVLYKGKPWEQESGA